MRQIMRGAIAVAAVIAFATKPADAQVVNGGFETGDFTGWTLVFGCPCYFNPLFAVVDPGAAHQGGYGAAFGTPDYFRGGPNATGLGQVVPTTIGQVYVLSFWLANGGGYPDAFELLFGGHQLMDINYPPPGGGPGFDWTYFSFPVVATSTSSELGFTFTEGSSFWGIDDITLAPVETTVPEPASMLLLASGLTGIAGARMRQRRKV